MVVIFKTMVVILIFLLILFMEIAIVSLIMILYEEFLSDAVCEIIERIQEWRKK